MKDTYQLHDTVAKKALKKHPRAGIGYPARWTVDEGTALPDPNYPTTRKTPLDPEGSPTTNLAWMKVITYPAEGFEYATGEFFDSNVHIAEREDDYVAKTEGWKVRDLTADELEARIPPVPRVERVPFWIAVYEILGLEEADVANYVEGIPDPAARAVGRIRFKHSLRMKQDDQLLIGVASDMHTAGALPINPDTIDPVDLPAGRMYTVEEAVQAVFDRAFVVATELE